MTDSSADNYSSVFQWIPANHESLRRTEQLMLKRSKVDYKQYFVHIGEVKINTIQVGTGTPLVLLHGFGAGVGFWTSNLSDLARHHTVYAFDMIGFGRSSRHHDLKSPKDEHTAEDFFMYYIDAWRRKMKLDHFLLLGHSFGGYLAGCYALKHPDVVKALILADPWGIPVQPQKTEQTGKRSMLFYAIYYGSKCNLSPFSAMRAAGPWGKGLLEKFRPDLLRKFVHLFDDEIEAKEILEEYIFQLNAQIPATGETAFNYLTAPIGWAKKPLRDRLTGLHASVPVYFTYGSDSWMDISAGFRTFKSVYNHRKQNPEPDRFIIIKNSSHHVYVDQWQTFNQTILSFTKPFHSQSPSHISVTTKKNLKDKAHKKKDDDPEID
eukprot:TRINITY_DN2626_c0_g1_i3.p1 TRINITY_DN2626_c0_g1~~TRINITY_DN2626_c0_g1_i3.p1  ORF type:complete len:410 (+),score=44.52 TRINITY_DN2626_c0_g1_i3:96-1232(+)